MAQRTHQSVAIFSRFTPLKKEKVAIVDLRKVAARLSEMRERGDTLYPACVEYYEFCRERISAGCAKITLRFVAVKVVEGATKNKRIFQAAYNDGTRLHTFRVSEECLAGTYKAAIRKATERRYALFCLVAGVVEGPRSLVYAVR